MEPIARPNYGVRQELITEDEILQLIYLTLLHSGKPWYERDLLKVVEWVQEARLRAGIIESVLSGELTVSKIDAGTPLIGLTPVGTARAKKIQASLHERQARDVDQLQQRVAELEKALKCTEDERAALDAKWRQMEAYGFTSPKAVFDRLHGAGVVTGVTASDSPASNEAEKQEAPESVVERTLDGRAPLPPGVKDTPNNRALAAVVRGNAAALVEQARDTPLIRSEKSNGSENPAPLKVKPDLNGRRSGVHSRRVGDEPPPIPRGPVEKPIAPPREDPVTEDKGLRLPKQFEGIGWAKRYEQKCLDAGLKVRVEPKEGGWIVRRAM